MKIAYTQSESKRESLLTIVLFQSCSKGEQQETTQVSLLRTYTTIGGVHKQSRFHTHTLKRPTYQLKETFTTWFVNSFVFWKVSPFTETVQLVHFIFKQLIYLDRVLVRLKVGCMAAVMDRIAETGHYSSPLFPHHR